MSEKKTLKQEQLDAVSGGVNIVDAAGEETEQEILEKDLARDLKRLQDIVSGRSQSYEEARELMEKILKSRNNTTESGGSAPIVSK